MLYSRLRFASRLGCVVVASVVVALATASLPLKAAGLAEGDLPASLTSALVRVELLAQTSGGDQPDAAGWNQRCPNCGNYHDSALDTAYVAVLERAAEWLSAQSGDPSTETDASGT